VNFSFWKKKQMIESAENMLGLSHSISRITHYLITSNGPAV